MYWPVSKQCLASIVVAPGPVNGMTNANAFMVKLLGLHFNHRNYPLQRGFRAFGLTWKIRKTINETMASFWLLFGDGRNAETVHISPNAGLGLLQTVILVASCKFRHRRVLLHHHVCSYTNHRSFLMSQIQRMLEKSDVQISLGSEQSSGLRKYKSAAQLVEIPYAYLTINRESALSEHSEPSENRVFTLGHLSNLTVEKGLLDVLEVVRTLAQRGQNIRLVLAGPARNYRAAQAIENAIEELGPARIDYRGPVYGANKLAFFEEIDCFLMPSRYRNEAQPIVLIEAMSYGLPAITSRQGCMRSLAGSLGFLTIDEMDEFTKFSVQLIENFIESPTEYAATRMQARQRYEELRMEAEGGLQRLLQLLGNDYPFKSHIKNSA